MNFSEQKKKTLTRVDKSKKGEIDAGILDLVNLINSKDSYYTTSSCSGRIILIQKKSAKKFDCEWILVSHDQIKLEDVKKALHEPLDAKVWFRQEPMILHVACKTIDDAKRFLKLARQVYKRAGIISPSGRIIVELIGSEFMDTIVSKDKKLLVSDEYLKILVDEANIKLASNKNGIGRFYELLKSLN